MIYQLFLCNTLVGNRVKCANLAFGVISDLAEYFGLTRCRYDDFGARSQSRPII